VALSYANEDLTYINCCAADSYCLSYIRLGVGLNKMHEVCIMQGINRCSLVVQLMLEHKLNSPNVNK